MLLFKLIQQSNAIVNKNKIKLINFYFKPYTIGMCSTVISAISVQNT